MLSDAPPLRVGQEELVDSVVVDVTIYNPGGPHLGAFPGPLLGAFRQLYLSPTETYVFRIDADVIQNVSQKSTARGVSIDEHVSKVGIFTATEDSLVHEQREKRRDKLIRFEGSFQFDPARSDTNFEALRAFTGGK